MARTRSPLRPVNLTADQIAAAAKAERARKRESRKALRTADPTLAERKQGQAKVEASLDAQTQIATTTPPQPQPNEAYVAALRVDWEALGSVGSFEDFLAEQGVSPDGAPLKQEEEKKCGYDGPMLALKHARVHYQKAANGILCNGDKLAVLCGKHEREATVRALILALKLSHNPYAHLNAGQQSMNLRNKARRALNEGTLTLEQIEAAYDAA